MGKCCKKCGYERQDNDTAPDYECPKCGAIYAKVEARIKSEAEAQPQSKPITEKLKRKPSSVEVEPRPLREEAKSLPLGIGLNVLFPGLGYVYMGKWTVGVIAGLLITMIYLSSSIILILPTWLVMNIIMAIDIVILSNKDKKKIVENNMKKCSACAELIQKEAKVCRFCGAKFELVSE